MEEKFKRKKKLKGVLLFFRSLIPFILAMGLFLAFIIVTSTEVINKSSITYFLFYLPSGAFLGILYKEIVHPEEYYFYYNTGNSKVELWTGSLLLSYSFYIIFRIITIIWEIASKQIAY